ncbi:Pleckstrin y domain-containing family A member 5 [Merluccius polli]|uniref:Pleckstrin y domain-containing family A member 5 n=1 Tax=Merluccius polli TaxID=89951 RepID=A0AA47M1W7_MERPO|nr:Pleckstrin y domain-containing family A member 5 [Merluccius polli]
MKALCLAGMNPGGYVLRSTLDLSVRISQDVHQTHFRCAPLPWLPCARLGVGGGSGGRGGAPPNRTVSLDMAADLHPEWISCLPPAWTYGVTRDGRVFFVNEEAKSTTWLHPVSGEAVVTGHRKTPGTVHIYLLIYFSFLIYIYFKIIFYFFCCCCH